MAIYVGTESPKATLNKEYLEKGEYSIELEGCEVISKEKVFIETFFTGTLSKKSTYILKVKIIQLIIIQLIDNEEKLGM